MGRSRNAWLRRYQDELHGEHNGAGGELVGVVWEYHRQPVHR